MEMEDEDIEDLTKHAPSRGSNRAPIGLSYKRELMSFMRFTTERIEYFADVGNFLRT